MDSSPSFPSLSSIPCQHRPLQRRRVTPESNCHTGASGPFTPSALEAAELAGQMPGSSSVLHTTPNVSLQGISFTI